MSIESEETGPLGSVILVEDLDLAVGEITFVSNIDEPDITIKATILDFTKLDEGHIKIAIPMGTSVGDKVFAGSLFFELRDLWKSWFDDHPEEGHDNA